MRGKVVVAGIGQTKFGSLPGRSTISLVVEAVRNALEDARIEKDLVDALLVKPPTSLPGMMIGQKVAEAMGLKPKFGMAWDQGGGAVTGCISYASFLIEAGLCDVAVVTFSDNPKSFSAASYSAALGDTATFGYVAAAASYAMVARRHMKQFGTTERQLGAIPVNGRRNGATNPNAQLRAPLSIDEYLEKPFLISPFRRDDFALVSDGGAALVLMSAERAKQLGVPDPVPILGFGAGQESWNVELRDDLTTTMAATSAAMAFQMAGLGPRDMDTAQLYDCFSIVPIITLEDYGFCAKGHGGRYVEEGAIGLDGEIPLNTAGGLLSETGMPGMQMVLEGIRQVRGTAANQVKNVRNSIISTQGGIMQTHGTLIVGR